MSPGDRCPFCAARYYVGVRAPEALTVRLTAAYRNGAVAETDALRVPAGLVPVVVFMEAREAVRLEDGAHARLPAPPGTQGRLLP